MPASGGPARRRHASSDALLPVPPLPWPRRPDRHPLGCLRNLSTNFRNRTLAADDIGVRSVRVLGVRVDCVDLAGSLAAIESMVRQGGGTRLVATVNPEFVMRARADQVLGRALEEAALCVPDGAGVVWAMRRQGCRGQPRVTGSDL